MRSRVPAVVASAVGGRGTIEIRYACPADAGALARLESLSGRSLGGTSILVAVTDGDLIAAARADGREIVSDPFRVTLDVTELLRLRARQLRAAA
jgi:hypothetical protein